MRYPSPANSLLLAATLFVVTGLSAVLAQSGLSQADKAGIEQAIKDYQSGSKGDVVRYLMQKGYEGSVAAQFSLGVINYQREDQAVGLREAQFWFAEAAEEGDLVAQMNLGILKLEAGAKQQNADEIGEGIGWLRRAAESGYRPAQVNLGGLLAVGTLQTGRKNEGLAWLQLAADAGDPRAAEILVEIADAESNTDPLLKLYGVDMQLRSEVYRGGSAVITPDAPVYARPSVAMTPIAAVNAGVLVEVLDRDAEWVSVKIPAGLPVWLSASAVEIEEDLVRVNRLEAALYSAPSADAESVGLGTVTKGETLAFVERRDDWVLVRSPERFAGWMQQNDVQSRIAFQPDNAAEPDALVSENTTASVQSVTPVTARLISDAEILRLPERDAGVLGVVAAKSEVTIIDSRDGYGFAESLVVSGWVEKTQLKFDDQAEGNNLLARTVVGSVSVRLRPDVESSAFSSLSEGAEFAVLEQAEEWVRVVLGQGSGWIIAELVGGQENVVTETGSSSQQSDTGATAAKSNASGSAPEMAESTSDSESGQPLASVAKQVAEEQQLIETESEKPAEEAVGKTPESASGNTVRRVQSDAVLYTTNSTSSKPLGRISSDIELTDVPETDMIKVETPAAVYGWIFAGLLSEQDGEAVVLKDGVRIRLDPTTERNNIVGSLNTGASRKRLDRQGDWVKVALTPVTGWVLSGDVE